MSIKGGQSAKRVSAARLKKHPVPTESKGPRVPIPLRSKEDLRDEARRLRLSCSRASLGSCVTAAPRPDVITLLRRSSKGRLASLVPLRYGRMLVSPFTFFRGAASIMASDLADKPRTGLNLQICGDCHLLNFGGFATPERKLAFDINDFDETLVGPWEWDIKRLVTSLVVASRDRGFTAEQSSDIAWECADAFRSYLRDYAKRPILDAWYDQIDLAQVMEHTVDDDMRNVIDKRVHKAVAQSAHTREFVKLAVAGGKPPLIKDNPPLIFHDLPSEASARRAEISASMALYRESLAPDLRILVDRFTIADFALKVVGVGSVGTYCGILLMVSANGDPLFLQVKEARESVLAPYLKVAPIKHQGRRVVEGQRMMQAASDIFLGWTQGPKRQFYIRQLRDAKIAPPIESMKANNLKRYGMLCARALARAHARSGDTPLLAKYLGSSDEFADAMTSFAAEYADQNEQDYEAFSRSVQTGQLPVTTID